MTIQPRIAHCLPQQQDWDTAGNSGQLMHQVRSAHPRNVEGDDDEVRSQTRHKMGQISIVGGTVYFVTSMAQDGLHRTTDSW